MLNPNRAFKTFSRILGVKGFLSASVAHFTRKQILLSAKIDGVSKDGVSKSVQVRVPGSDLMVFEQVVLRGQYKLPVRREPTFIVDAGANIGLASVMLALQFPNARILSLEPEKNNFDLLVKNTAAYPNVTPVQGALWSETAELHVVDSGTGNWGFQVGTPGAGTKVTGQTIRAYSVETILRDFGAATIDILKIDIEGSELEIFQAASGWIDRVDSIVIELHDRIRPGCNRAFYNATNDFAHEWLQDEVVCLTRENGCLLPPGPSAQA